MIDDPLLRRRKLLGRVASVGKRIGYGLFLASLVIFLFGFSTELTPWMAGTIIVCLAVGSVVLAPAVVLGYAVRAAEREDNGGSFH